MHTSSFTVAVVGPEYCGYKLSIIILSQPFSLNSDNFTTNGTSYTLSGLNDDTVTLSATLSKNEIKSKLKIYNKSQLYYVRLSRDRTSGVSGNISNSVQDGLTFDTRFGYHILYMDDKRIKNVSDNIRRNQAIAVLKDRKVAIAKKEWLAKLKDQAYIEYVK